MWLTSCTFYIQAYLSKLKRGGGRKMHPPPLSCRKISQGKRCLSSPPPTPSHRPHLKTQKLIIRFCTWMLVSWKPHSFSVPQECMHRPELASLITGAHALIKPDTTRQPQMDHSNSHFSPHMAPNKENKQSHIRRKETFLLLCFKRQLFLKF